MITPDLQPTLFTTTKEDALTSANTSISQAKLWYNQNYLSYDISKVNELQHFEVLELTFISQLFKSKFNLEVINQLLFNLSKPYAYDYNSIYFDVFSNSWESLPKEIDKDEIMENYFDNLNAEDDREKIEEMVNILQEFLR